jgi:small GTP-binding protein
MAVPKAPQIFKVVLLGNSGVGKSNLLSRLNTNEFSEEFLSTIGVEFLTKILEVDGVKVKAQIWDTAGQERYNSMMATYYRNAKGAIIVYDITNPKSFEAAERWRTEIAQQADPGLVIMLAGNQCDLEARRRVPTEQASAYAATASAATGKKPLLFAETSAKSGHNVQKVFIDLLTSIHRTRGGAAGGAAAPLALSDQITLNTSASQPEKASCC